DDPVTTLDEGHNVREAVEIVNASKIGAVPVIDGEGRLTGIVTGETCCAGWRHPGRDGRYRIRATAKMHWRTM
ncbi:CBS domain-containing protein, partial [Pantoea vagans]|uniref:CBS domain-containing protein n=1 Tax=Pantoea vagans TaxID=470934 RepID=UPI001C9D0ECC